MQRLFLGTFLGVAATILLAVAAIGWLVDPFARFGPPDDGLDRGPAYTLNRSLFKLIAFERAAGARGRERLRVLVGDSMGNQLDAADLARATGRPWFNFSYGAATLEENLHLLRALLERDDGAVGEIVWSLPFTKFRHSAKNTIPRSLRMARQPWLHLFTHESLLASYYVMRKHWLSIGFSDEFIDMPDSARVDYFLYRMQVDLEGVAWPDELVAEVETIEALARARGIALSFMVPPAHPRARAMFATEFADRFARYRAFLEDRGCVHDLEAKFADRWTPERFIDAVHLKQEHRPLLLAALVEARRRGCGPMAPAEPAVAANR